MSSAAQNLAAAGQRVRERAAQSPGLVNRLVGGLRGRVMTGTAQLLDHPSSHTVRDAAVETAKGVATTGYSLAERMAAPGGRVADAANQLADKVVSIPGAERAGVGTLPITLAAGGGLLYAVRDNPDRPLAVEDIDPYTGFSNYQRLNEAYDSGISPMSTTFNGFITQKRAQAQEKNASMFRGLSQKGLGALDELAKKLIMKNVDEDVTARVVRRLEGTTSPWDFEDLEMRPEALNKELLNTAKNMNFKGELNAVFGSDPADRVRFQHQYSELDPRKALMLGAAGVGLGTVGAAVEDNPLQPLGYKARKVMFDVNDRIGADELYAKTYVQQLAKDNAALLGEMVRDSTLEAQEAVKAIPRAKQQMSAATELMQEDEVLSTASEADRQMLMRAFQSMQKFAPTLAGDEFAVRNYLREALMAANGPDYGTIGNLARAERDVTGGPKR